MYDEIKNALSVIDFVESLAERGGFEPPVELPLLRFSRPVRSAAPASLRILQ